MITCINWTWLPILYVQVCLFVMPHVYNPNTEVSALPINNTTHRNVPKSRKNVSTSNKQSYFDSSRNHFESLIKVIKKRANQPFAMEKTESRPALLKNQSIISLRKHSDDFPDDNLLVARSTEEMPIDQDEDEDDEIDEIHQNEMYSEANMGHSEGTSHENSKHGLKGRRFLSNVKASLKEHIKKGGDAWRPSKKEIKKMFEDYYTCLKEKIETIHKEEFPIKAHLAIEGESVQMFCKACYRPDESMDSQKAIWQVLRHETSALEQVHENDRMHISKDYTLLIEKIDVSDAGQYFCLERRDYLSVYQLDVFLEDKRRSFRLGDEPLAPETFLMKHNLRVFTMWASWGECNTCDRAGEKARIGQCTVKKLYQDIPVFPRDYALMAVYPEGVPCHSTALPRHIRGMAAISRRESETILIPCKEPCPTDPPVSKITDESGNVVEVVDAGFHSMKDKPLLPSLVKRKVLYENEKSHLLLNCPTEHEPNMIHWARGEREVDPIEIKKLTKGRVWVDELTRLHFKPLLLSDTDVYNCWKRTVRIASMKLIVVDAGNQKIKHYISYAGLAATAIGSMICLFCICCKKSDKNAA